MFKHQVPPPIPTPDGRLALSPRLDAFRRLYRWLNLTLIHQGLWPLVLLVTTAPLEAVSRLPVAWFVVACIGPAAATALAAVYLRLRPLPSFATSKEAPAGVRNDDRRRGREQARFLVLGLPVMLAVARLLTEPTAPVLKLLLFGAAEVAAYQLIHFGVVARTYASVDQSDLMPVFLFGVSWGLRSVFLVSVGLDGGSTALAFGGGFALGTLIALVSLALRRWLGGFWPAAATHWLIVYLVFGFTA